MDRVLPYILLFTQLLLCCFTFGQTNGTKRPDCSDTTIVSESIMAGLAIHNSDPDSSLAIWNKALKTLGSLEFSGCADMKLYQMKADLMHNRGVVCKYMGRSSEAIEAIEMGIELFRKVGNTKAEGIATNDLATVYEDLGDVEKAVELYHQSLHLREKTNDMEGKAYSLNNLGLLYKRQGDASKAEENYKLALKLFRSLDDSLGMATALNNIGVLCNNRGHLDSALVYYGLGLSIREAKGDLRGTTHSLGNIAIVQEKLGNLIYAGELFQRTLIISDSIRYQDGVALAYYDIAFNALKQGNMGKATEYGKQALEAACQLGFPSRQQKAAILLKDISLQKGDFKNAFEMFSLEIEMRDSIQNMDNRRAMIHQQFQYDYEKKEAILKTEQEAKDVIATAHIRNQRIAMMGMAGGGLLLLGLGISGFLLFRQRKRNETLAHSIAARDAERNRLARELHDGVAGELFGLQMAVQGNKPIDMRNELGRLRDEIRHISHDLAMPDIQKTSLPEMADYLIGRHRHTGREVVLMVQPPDDAKWTLPPDKAQHIYRMLQEGLGNALRHTAAEDLIKVRLNRTATEVNISIENPNGKTVEPVNGNGIGLKNLRERAELIGASVTLREENNSIVLHIIVPLTD